MTESFDPVKFPEKTGEQYLRPPDVSQCPCCSQTPVVLTPLPLGGDWQQSLQVLKCVVTH